MPLACYRKVQAINLIDIKLSPHKLGAGGDVRTTNVGFILRCILPRLSCPAQLLPGADYIDKMLPPFDYFEHRRAW